MYVYVFYVSMFIWINICMCVCIYICMYAYKYVCLYIWMNYNKRNYRLQKFIILNVFCYVDIGHNQTVYIGVKNDPIGTQCINSIPAPSGDRT